MVAQKEWILGPVLWLSGPAAASPWFSFADCECDVTCLVVYLESEADDPQLVQLQQLAKSPVGCPLICMAAE